MKPEWRATQIGGFGGASDELMVSSVGASGKEPAANAGDFRDAGSILGSGRTPGEGNGNPLQYPCLENPKEGGAWWATVHGVAESWTQLND